MAWSDKLKGLFGVTPKPAAKKRGPAKTYNPSTNRAEIIKEAMAVYSRERANVRGVLEQALKELQAKPPRPSDVEGMARFLSLRQAVARMKGAIGHDLKRFLVLANVRALTEQGAKPAKPAPRRVTKR